MVSLTVGAGVLPDKLPGPDLSLCGTKMNIATSYACCEHRNPEYSRMQVSGECMLLGSLSRHNKKLE